MMESTKVYTEEKEKIHPAAQKVKGKIKIMVVEDSEFYNAIITRQIQRVLNSIDKLRDTEFELIRYLDVNYCVTDIQSNKFDGVMTIAFLDHYLSQAMNGLKLSKMIKSINKTNKVILLTQSNDFNLWKKLRRSQGLESLHKDEFTPSKCRDILEKILFRGSHN